LVEPKKQLIFVSTKSETSDRVLWNFGNVASLVRVQPFTQKNY